MTRSWLFVPGDRAERFAKAAASGADAVIVDLEDAVASDEKATARTQTAAWLAAGHTVWVRVNANDEDDLHILEGLSTLSGIVLPKSEEPREVEYVHRRLGVPVVALVETAHGIENVGAIARANGVSALALGVADLRLDARLGDSPIAWAYARSRLVFASRANGLAAPIDGPAMNLDDPGVTAAEAANARAFGFGGKLCIHPRQVAAVNSTFGADADALAWARRVITATAAEDGAAVRVDGEMIDRPRLELARRLLADANP